LVIRAVISLRQAAMVTIFQVLVAQPVMSAVRSLAN
jgi:hypothetical protein